MLHLYVGVFLELHSWVVKTGCLRRGCLWFGSRLGDVKAGRLPSKVILTLRKTSMEANLAFCFQDSSPLRASMFLGRKVKREWGREDRYML